MIVAVAGASVAGCNPDAMTGPSDAASPRTPRTSVVVNEQRVPITPTYPHPCVPADGMIAFSGYLHTVITATADANGGVHLGVQVKETSLTGVGVVTGRLYRASSELHQTVNDRGSAPLTTTVTDHFRITGSGPDDNFFMRMTTHLTVNANGVPTADVAHADMECR